MAFKWFDLSRHGKKISLIDGNPAKLVITGRMSSDVVNALGSLGFVLNGTGNPTLTIGDGFDIREVETGLKRVFPRMHILSEGDRSHDDMNMTPDRFMVHENGISEDMERDAFERIGVDALTTYAPEVVASVHVPNVDDPLYVRVTEAIRASGENGTGNITMEMAREIRDSGVNILSMLPARIQKSAAGVGIAGIFEVNGNRYAIHNAFRDGSIPVLVENERNSAGRFWRGMTIEQRMNMMRDMATELETSVVRGHEFRNFVRVIYGLPSDGDIPEGIMNEARDLMTANIERVAISRGSQKTVDRWRKLNQLVENNAIQATMPPTVPMAIIRSLGIEQMPPDDRNIMVVGDNTGLLAMMPNTLTASVSGVAVADDSRVNVMRRLYREAGMDSIRVVNEVPDGFEADIQLIDLSSGADHSMEAIDRLLAVRKESGRTSIILPSGGLSSDELDEIGFRYGIDGVADIAFPMPGISGRVYRATVLSVGARRPEPVVDRVSSYLQRQHAENTQTLWTWGASVIASRGNESQDFDENAEDNDYQTPYTPMSNLGESRTMVPKNLMGPTMESQKKVREHFDGQIDAAVAAAIGTDPEHVNDYLSPEQIDCVATGLYRLSRKREEGDAILIADDTGIGKGRECCSMASAMLRNGDRVVYMTEYGSSFSDVWREFKSIGTADDFHPFILNNEPIISESGDVIMEPTPRHIITGATCRSFWPDGTDMRFITLSRQEAVRLRRAYRHVLAHPGEYEKEQVDEAKFISNALRGRQLTLIGDEAVPHMVNTDEIKKDWIENPSYNTLFTSYSQVNKATLEDQKRRHKTRNDKSQFLVDVFKNAPDDNRISIVLDEAHNAASNTSNMGKNIGHVVDAAHHVVYSTATWSKGVKNLGLYSRLFSSELSMSHISEIMEVGGTTAQETLTRLMVSEGSYIRRELDVTRAEFVNRIDDARKERNIEVVNSVASVLSAIAVMGGEIEERVSILNRQREADRQIMERENADQEVQVKMFGTSPFGTSVSSFSRVESRSMILEMAVEIGIEVLENGGKPVFVQESTLERFVTKVKKEHADPNYVPDIKDYLRHILEQSMKITTPDGKKISIIEEDRERDLAEDIIQNFTASIPEAMRGVNDETIGIEENEAAIEAIVNESGAENVREYILGLMDAACVRVLEGANLSDDANNRVWNLATMNLRNRPLNERDITGYVRAAVNITEDMPMNPARTYRSIQKLINEVPDLPVSAIDYIKNRIQEKGYSIGEITGRSMIIDPEGNLVQRTKESKGAVKDKFNRGEYDAVALNGAGATGIDMHASQRFATRDNARSMIFLEDLRNPTLQKQMCGRVFRYDQVLNPTFITCMSGMPVETRRFMMQNAKNRGLSASMTANRENAHLQKDVPDIINRVGDVIAARFLMAEKDITDNLGLKHKRDELLAAYAERIEEGQGFLNDDNELRADMNQLISRVESLLPYHEQIRVMASLESEYAAYVEELNAAGANPLMVKHIAGDWSCNPNDRVLIRGQEHEDGQELSTGDSIMNQPLYVEKGRFTRRVVANSIRSGRLMSMVERSQQMLGEETPEVRGRELWDLRNSILQSHMPMGSNADATEIFEGNVETVGAVSPVFKQSYMRLKSLCDTLSQIQVGSEITVKEGEQIKKGVITGIHMPGIDEKNATLASFYEVSYLTPGAEYESKGFGGPNQL